MKIGIVLSFFFILIACGSSKTRVAATAESRALDELVAARAFMIESTWASPSATSSMNAIANSGLLGNGNSAGNINLMGNPNFFKIEGDTISADLPYFGERQMGGGYTSESGIKFKGVPDNVTIKKDDSTQRYTMSFKISEAIEAYTIYITLFPNWSSTMSINSTQRTSINYKGEVIALPEKE
tara:strand:- start:2541 stop:3089 length:549 start_codon:yes stop_codon:yes gene_type:complete